MSVNVWVLGDAVVDLLPEADGRLLSCPGGAPANVAVGIARLGGRTGFIGRVGSDPFGALMKRTLMAEGVDTAYLTEDKWHRTLTVLVSLEQGERSFTFMVHPSADLMLEKTDLPRWHCGEWLHLCSIALSAEPSRSRALAAMSAQRHAGGFVSFDPNIRQDLWPDTRRLHQCLQQALQLADVVKLSEEELTFITGEPLSDQVIRTLATGNDIRLLLVTRGGEGVEFFCRGNVRHFPGMPVTCIDSTGAGDAFVAGLLAWLAARGFPENDDELQQMIDQAQRCGALAVTALPRRQALAQGK